MSTIKTQRTTASVRDFLKTVADEDRRKDCQALVRLMERVVQAKGKMWGPSIVGFGDYRYQNASGTNDWFIAGFSPRKRDLTLYLMAGFDRYPALMKRLGKYSTGKSCLYIKSLADVDVAVLEDLVASSTADIKKRGSGAAVAPSKKSTSTKLAARP